MNGIAVGRVFAPREKKQIGEFAPSYHSFYFLFNLDKKRR